MTALGGAIGQDAAARDLARQRRRWHDDDHAGTRLDPAGERAGTGRHRGALVRRCVHGLSTVAQSVAGGLLACSLLGRLDAVLNHGMAFAGSASASPIARAATLVAPSGAGSTARVWSVLGGNDGVVRLHVTPRSQARPFGEVLMWRVDAVTQSASAAWAAVGAGR
jgi:hypothetical protein